MIGDLLQLLGLLAKHIWPFVREWLFKSNSLKLWVTRHWLHLFYLLLLFSSFYIIYRLFISTTQAHLQRQTLEKTVQQLKFEEQRKQMLIDRYELQLKTYQKWMDACKMPYYDLKATPYPTCHSAPTAYPTTPINIRPTKPNSPAVKKKSTSPSNGSKGSSEHEIVDKVKDIWGT